MERNDTTYAVHIIELGDDHNDHGRWADIEAETCHAAIEAALREAHLVGYGTGRVLARVYDRSGIDRRLLHRREFADVAVCPGLEAGDEGAVDGPREYHAECWDELDDAAEAEAAEAEMLREERARLRAERA